MSDDEKRPPPQFFDGDREVPVKLSPEAAEYLANTKRGIEFDTVVVGHWEGSVFYVESLEEIGGADTVMEGKATVVEKDPARLIGGGQ